MTISLAVPGDPLVQPLKTREFKASEIDAVLGNTQFTRLVENIFVGLEDVRSAIAQETRVSFENFPDVKRGGVVSV